MKSVKKITVVAAAALTAFAASGGFRLGGHVGAKADELFEKRLACEKARGDIFAEAENAFATRYDDLHPAEDDFDRGRHYGFWQGEYWGKTMLSYCDYARYSGREDMRRFVRSKARQFVRGFQRENGYLCSYDNEDFVVGWCWNVWSRKYTMWALIAAFDLTGDRELLDAAAKMADHLIAQLERLRTPLAFTGCFEGLPSTSVINPVLALYERTGERRYLDFADAIAADNDRADGRAPNLIANAFGDRPVHEWYPNPEKWAKAYEMLSCLEGFVAYSRITGRRRALDAAVRIWDKLHEAELNVLGGVGCHDHFIGAAAFPDSITETCDVIHWIRLCRCLHLATGDAKYLDAAEKAFYNAFLAGAYRGGEWATHDVRSHGRRHLTGMYEVKMTYHFCCLDNLPRAFATWSEMAVRRTGDGVYDVDFYGPGEYTDGGVSITIGGDYPVGGEVTVKVVSPMPVKLRFRRPGWCGSMKVDGAAVGGGYHAAAAEGGRVFRLDFAMPPRIVRAVPAFKAVERLDEVRRGWFEMTFHNPEMRGMARRYFGCSVERGPILLAKAAAVGGDDRTCFSDLGVDDGWKVSDEALGGKAVWGAWRLTFEKDGVRKTVNACDYSSAADYDAPRNSFSVWF